MKTKKLLKKISILSICALLLSQMSFFALTSAQIKTDFSDEGSNFQKTDSAASSTAAEIKEPMHDPIPIAEPIYKEPIIKKPITTESQTSGETIKFEEKYAEPNLTEPIIKEPMPTESIYKPRELIQPESFEKKYTESFHADTTDTKEVEIKEPIIKEPTQAEQYQPEFKEPNFHKHINEIIPKKPIHEPMPVQPINEIEENIFPEGITPPICAEAGITSRPECEKLIREKFQTQESHRIEYEKTNTGNTNIKQPVNTQTQTNKIITKPKVEILTEEQLKNEKDILPTPCKNKGIENKEECFKFLQETEGVPLKCREKGITDKEECEKIMRQTNLPEACQKAGFTNIEECEKNMGANLLPPECAEKGAKTPQECEKLMQQEKLPIECIKQGITDEQKCHTTLLNINMPIECIKEGVTDREKCDEIMKIKSTAPECQKAGINDMRECEKLMMKLHMPPECQNAGITNMKQCEKLMMKKYMPKECQEAKAETKEGCEKIMVKKLMPQKCLDVGVETKKDCEKIIIAEQDKIEDINFEKNFPKECVNAGTADKEECKKMLSKESFPLPCQEKGIYKWKECRAFMEQKYMPDECANAGAKTPEECDKIMMQKHMPPECVEAKTTTKEECDKIMDKKYFPQECKNNGIETRKECDEYFMLKHMPQECINAQAKTPQECEQIMRQLHLTGECKTAEIADDAQCKEYMFNKYKPQEIQCEGLTKAECEEELKKNHLGLMVEDRKEKVKIKEQLLPHVGKKILFKNDKLIKTTDDGNENVSPEDETKLIDVMPLKTDKELAINILPSNEKSLLKEDIQTIIQSVPVIIVIDSDQDGLPDDMEKRMGTNPKNSDTDNDGYLDGEEVKNNFNPSGQGKLIQTISSIENAILNQEILEQPLTDGEVKENIMRVNDVSSIDSDNDGQEYGIKISGTAIPNTVVSLYVYSSIAILATVQADENGNWEHTFEHQLKDGEHDIYAAISDSNGKIEAKSNPKSFFIEEEKPIEAKNFVSSSMSKTTRQFATATTPSNFNEFLLLLLSIMILGISTLMLQKVANKTTDKGKK